MNGRRNTHAGAGGALMMLVFATLCMTIFTLISFAAARAERTVSDRMVAAALAYYEADAWAECVVSDILSAKILPETMRETALSYNERTGEISFSCGVDEQRALFVVLSRKENGYIGVREWRLRDTDEWIIDGHLPVWTGD